VLDEALVLRTGLPGPVTLRRLTRGDAHAVAALVAADEPRLGEHLSWPAVTTTPEGAERWLGPYEDGEGGRVLMAGAWHAHELLGGAMLLNHDATNANVELGCWLATAAEGHGVAAAACRALLRIARAELGAERVEWRASTKNERSRRLAGRLGFRYEGTLRADYALRGTRLDTDVLSLVGGEIDAAASGGDAP